MLKQSWYFEKIKKKSLDNWNDIQATKTQNGDNISKNQLK